mmetsp:Transcript_8723/g.12340  ORF Transcript_8723/g.12340 Transcript_8723/m.12340 type:complete len:370 (-) Transcript_8723:87-1196(-)
MVPNSIMTAMFFFGVLATPSTFAAFTSGPSDIAFVNPSSTVSRKSNVPLFMVGFAADGSEYSSKDSDYDADEEDGDGAFGRTYKDELDSPTEEIKPVPTSKNSGNRFVAVCWDKELDTEGRDIMKLHYDRIALTEDHIMFCRKANLYNETFNTDSMVDILWSYPILASDLQRVIGHAMCMESTKLEYVQELMAREPIIQSLTGGDISNIPLYRWRHIRDYSLRQDDGRFGTPVLCLALDHTAEEGVGNLREETATDHLEYLIRSERVIAAGPVHLPTEFKDDPSSIAVGNLILFNAEDREDAIEFAENDPAAKNGLYKSMRVHSYNNLDVTGKFVAEDDFRDKPGEQMKEAMEVWGYPVSDSDTPWLNW